MFQFWGGIKYIFIKPDLDYFLRRCPREHLLDESSGSNAPAYIIANFRFCCPEVREPTAHFVLNTCIHLNSSENPPSTYCWNVEISHNWISLLKYKYNTFVLNQIVLFFFLNNKISHLRKLIDINGKNRIF